MAGKDKTEENGFGLGGLPHFSRLRFTIYRYIYNTHTHIYILYYITYIYIILYYIYIYDMICV